MTGIVTIFDSDELPEEELGGYEVSVALGPDGKVSHVLLLDHERLETFEAPAPIALAIAKAILEQVRDPDTALH